MFLRFFLVSFVTFVFILNLCFLSFFIFSCFFLGHYSDFIRFFSFDIDIV